MSDRVRRDYALRKGSERVTATFVGSSCFRPLRRTDPISRHRVFGVDTESFRAGSDGTLTTVFCPLAFSDGTVVLDVRDRDPLEALLEEVSGRYGMPEQRKSRTEQRPRRSHASGARRNRDGRRQTVEPCVAVFFNLAYDLGRLSVRCPAVTRAIVSGADSYRVQVSERFELEVSRMVVGASSSFEWYVRDAEKRTICRVVGIDLTGYWRSSLDAAAAAAARGVEGFEHFPQKIDLDELVPEAFGRPLEEFSQEEHDHIVDYSGRDAAATMELYHATVELLLAVDARVVRRTGVIPPSAPGASARIMFGKAFDLHPGLESWERPPAWAEQMGCDAYFGGRSFCARPGAYAGMRVWDLKSAYPSALARLPDPVTMEPLPVEAGPFEVENWRGQFGVLYVDGESLCDIYPPARCHDEDLGRVRYVFGKFEGLPMTIPEAVIGVMSGALRIDRIHRGVLMSGSSERSFLAEAVRSFVRIKESAEDPALRQMAKLLANSAYGKLIECNQTDYFLESSVICSDFVDKRKLAERCAKVYAESPMGEADARLWEFVERLESHGFDCEDSDCQGCEPPEQSDGPARPLTEILHEFKRYRCGEYFMPIYAAQVTGLTSASLCAMAREVGALQGDTDSVHVVGDPDASGYFRLMERAGYPVPKEGMGAWVDETPKASPEGSTESLLLRPKCYSHRFEARGSAEGSPVAYKQAIHGIPLYSQPEIEKLRSNREIPSEERAGLVRLLTESFLHTEMRGMAGGRSAKYRSRPAPRKILESAVLERALVGSELARALERGEELTAEEALVRVRPRCQPGEFVSRSVSVTVRAEPGTSVDSEGWVRWHPLEIGSSEPLGP